MHWYTDVLKKYAVFEGRATRQQYWMFVLISFFVSLALGIVDGAMDSEILGQLYMVAVFLPSLAVAIRRLHDTTRSGWWALLGLVPILGWIPLIIFLCTDSTPGTNQYGPNPKTMETPNPVPAPTPVAAAPQAQTQEDVVINDLPLAGEKPEEKV